MKQKRLIVIVMVLSIFVCLIFAACENKNNVSNESGTDSINSINSINSGYTSSEQEGVLSSDSSIQSEQSEQSEDLIVSLPTVSEDLSSLTESYHVEKTATPVVAQQRTVWDGRVIISGSCEEGATIYVFTGKRTLNTTKSKDGNFIIEFYLLAQDSPLPISLYAKCDGKSLSDPVESKAYYRTDNQGISDWVWAGKDSWLFFTASWNNYYRNDVFNDANRQKAKQLIQDRVEWLDSNLGAKPVYILAPNPNEIYGEFMPPYVQQRPNTKSLHEQTVEILREAGAIVVDMKPILEKHKNDEFFIYHRTDSHWTEYAAFYAYTELFNYIKQDFPKCAPRPMSDFRFSNQSRYGGDLYGDLGMDISLIREYSTFSNIKFKTPVYIDKYAHNMSTIISNEATKEHTFVNPDSNGRPNVFIMRDSYSIMMFDWVAERSATTTFRAMWDFTFDKQMLKNLDVDYVIYIICDMNLVNLYK